MVDRTMSAEPLQTCVRTRLLLWFEPKSRFSSAASAADPTDSRLTSDAPTTIATLNAQTCAMHAHVGSSWRAAVGVLTASAWNTHLGT